VRVVEKNQIRYLKLGNLIQSAWSPDKPNQLIFRYAKLIATAVTSWNGFKQNQKGKVLIIGLGGGTICRHLMKYYNNLQIDAVELDRVVYQYALKYFALNKKIKVYIMDGRKYVENTLKKYDIIILDAYSETYIPPQLMTFEFFKSVKKIMAKNGIFVVNTWETSNLHLHEMRTHQKVFGLFYELRFPDTVSENKIILAANYRFPPKNKLKKNMVGVYLRKGIKEFDIKKILTKMKTVENISPGLILTDKNIDRLYKKNIKNE